MSTKITYSISTVTWTDESANITGVTCATVGQFIVVGGGPDAFSVQWSAIGDPDDWPTPGTTDARSKQAGTQSFDPAYGVVTAIAGGDFFGYVFQENAITKMTYVGGDTVWSFDRFTEALGCFEYNRLAAVDDLIFFQSNRGHHALVNDSITDIGLGRVDKTFPPTTSTHAEYLDYGGSLFTGIYVQKNVVVNPLITTVFFEDNKLAYNYKTDQWTHVPALNSGSFFRIDDADGIVGQVVIASNLPSQQTSESGANSTATAVTGDFVLNPVGRAIVDSARPLHDGASLASIRVGVKDLLSDSVTWSTGTALNSRTGKSNFRGAANPAEGRYHRAELIFTGGFTTISGAEFSFIEAGEV